MKIDFVELSGFRGFKDATRFTFPAGFVVLTGRNGAGKSTVLDAIDFALTGTIDKFPVTNAKKGGLESHIWWAGSGGITQQYVTVGFVDENGEKLVVTRGRDRQLEPDIETLGQRLCFGPRASNWPRTLIQTSLIRDETLAGLSMDLPEQARFEAVRAAIGGLAGPDYSNRTSSLVDATKAAQTDQANRITQLQAELGRALTALTEARSIAERQTDVSEAEAIINRLEPSVGTGPGAAEQLRRNIAERRQSIQALTALIRRAEQLVTELEFINSEASQANIVKANEMIASLTNESISAREQLATAEAADAAEKEADSFATHMVAILNHGEEIGLVGGHCPLCDAARTDSEFSAAINAARTRLSVRGEVATRSAARVSQAKNKSKEVEVALANAQQVLANLESRGKTLASELARIIAECRTLGLNAEPSELDRAIQTLLQRSEETAEIERALFILETSGAHDRVVALDTRIQQLRSNLDKENILMTSADKALEAAKQIDNAAKTVANQVLTEQFDTVMPLLKELYQRLRPHASWRDIETDFGGKIRASLNFTVGDGKNPQFLFSSGQRRAAGLAFLLAIHLSRPWANLQTLLLDDPVQHIDDYRALNLVEVLSSIRRLRRQVIVAVEDPALADLLCRRLRSVPNETGRRFDLSTNSNGSASIERQTDILPLPDEVLQLSRAS